MMVLRRLRRHFVFRYYRVLRHPGAWQGWCLFGCASPDAAVFFFCRIFRASAFLMLVLVYTLLFAVSNNRVVVAQQQAGY